jgi:threonyl-tRNA synthetase
MSTIQLDFLLPKKFNLEFKDHDSEMKTPIMIHLSTIGTYERLLSILLEQSKGALKT